MRSIPVAITITPSIRVVRQNNGAAPWLEGTAPWRGGAGVKHGPASFRLPEPHSFNASERTILATAPQIE